MVLRVLKNFIEKYLKLKYYDSKIILNIYMRLWGGDQLPN